MEKRLTMKKLLLILLCLPLLTLAQQTYVPDDNFEAYLEANGMGNGITNDDYVFTNAIDTLTKLEFSFSTSNSITDLTGIENFVNLFFLDLPFIAVTSLDLSNNTALTFLRICNSQQMTDLNLQNGFNSSLDILLYGNLNLTCVQVDNVIWATSNWQPDNWTYFSTNCNTTSLVDYARNKKLVKVISVLGRETKEIKDDPLFYIYDDGTVNKRIVIKQ